MKIAIIGAGAAGLASARYAIANGFECDVFEMTDQVGGTWVYTDEVGTDKYGYPVHSAMYKNLRTNIPKESMGFHDFPMPECKRSYITQEEVLEFLQSFMDHFKLKRYIKFNTIVKEVIPLGSSSWKVTYVDKPSKAETTNIYDAVMVCNGHYSKPRTPEIDGQEKFTGDIRHSHSYRSIDMYKNKKVLIIGAGPSGVDITVHLSSVAKRVVLSHRLPKPFNLENVENKPEVKCIKDSRTIEFVDGSVSEVDAIIFCTGYYYSYPFLHQSCNIRVEDNRVQPLYKHLINIDKPTMCILGILYHVCPFPLVDLQARYFCTFLNGSMKLPTSEQMRIQEEKEITKRTTRGFPKNAAHHLGDDFETEYFEDLAAEAQITPFPPVTFKLRSRTSHNRKKCFLTFRDYNFRILDKNNFAEDKCSYL